MDSAREFGRVDFVGAGWAFPVSTDATGGIALVAGEREIAEAIRLILGTAPGERPMRPEFGCRINDHVFAPVNAATAGAIVHDVRSALEQWEPRIDLKDVRVSFSAAEAGTLYIDISYLIRGRSDPRNLVFPFYVIPDEAPLALVSSATQRISLPPPNRQAALPGPAGR